MYIIHRPSKIMRLRTRLPTLLRLALQPTKNVIERQPTLARRSHAPTSHTPHTAEALRLHRKVPRNVVTPMYERERGAAVRLFWMPGGAGGGDGGRGG